MYKTVLLEDFSTTGTTISQEWRGFNHGCQLICMGEKVPTKCKNSILVHFHSIHAIFDFYAGKHHKIMVLAWVEAVTVMLQMRIVQVEATKLTPQIGPSPLSGHRLLLILWRGACVGKVKVVPYTFICMEVPVREDTYPESSACEVGWPVPFLATFISPVFPLGIHLLLGEQ